MLQDLAALAVPAIACAAFVIGGWILLRHELAPKRRGRAGADDSPADEPAHERGERSES